jgi:hypothetical protein
MADSISLEGGGKLEAYLKELSKKISSGAVLEVGFPEGATYPDGTPVAYVAAIQEFGAPAKRIPARPFFRPMIKKNSDDWGPQLAKALKAFNYNAEIALEFMGQQIEGELQDSIIGVMAPALSPVTLMLRKMRAEDPNLTVTGKTVGIAAQRVRDGESTGGVSDKPLEDTKTMLLSVNHVVKKL